MNNQTGAASLLTIILLLAVIGVGVYVIDQQTHFLSRAISPAGSIELFGKYLSYGKTTSRLIGVKPTFPISSTQKPSYIRLANTQSGLDTGVVYALTGDNIANGIIWALAPAQNGNPTGDRTIWAQFQINGKWSSAVSTKVDLLETKNPYSLSVTCDKKEIISSGIPQARISWGDGMPSKITISIYDSKGRPANVKSNINPSKQSSLAFELPLLAEQYSVFAVGLDKDDKVIATSETTFACATSSKDTQVEARTIDGFCDNLGNCLFKWKPTRVDIYELTAWTNFTDTTNYLASSAINQKPLAILTKAPALTYLPGQLKNGHMYNLQVHSLNFVGDTLQASYGQDYYAVRKNFYTGSFTVSIDPTTATLTCSNGNLQGTVKWTGREAFTKDYIVDITDNKSHFDNEDGIWVGKEVHGSFSTDFSGFWTNPVIGNFPQSNKTYYLRVFDGTTHSNVISFKTNNSCGQTTKVPQTDKQTFTATCQAFTGKAKQGQEIHFWLYNTWCTLNPNMCTNNKDLPFEAEEWHGYLLGKATVDTSGNFTFDPQTSNNQNLTNDASYLNAKSKLYSGKPRTITAMWVDPTGYGVLDIANLTCSAQ